MKILIVSNLYPPHHTGGYELRCAQVAEFLREAGHEVRVLTSSYRVPADGNRHPLYGEDNLNGVPVERSLRHCRFAPPTGRLSALTMVRHQLRDVRRFIDVLSDFRPDIVNWWNLEGLAKAMLPIPAARGIPDVHCVDDAWMIREYGRGGERESLLWFRVWQGQWGPAGLRPLLRMTLAPWARMVQGQGIATRPFPLRARHVCFISEFRRLEHGKAGLLFPSSEVIYGGVAPERFYTRRAVSDFQRSPLRLLYAGFMGASRGLHTIVEALGLLPPDCHEGVTLSVAHTGPSKPGKYVEEIEASIERLGLSKRVTFLGKMGHDEMPRVYRDHQVLIFASTLPEGLPMTMMEAMCAGCAVITTGSGGAIELADLADLPIFPKDHPLALSRLLAKLVRNRDLVFRVATRGQEVVLREFTFSRMVQKFSTTLRSLTADTVPHDFSEVQVTNP